MLGQFSTVKDDIVNIFRKMGRPWSRWARGYLRTR